MLSCVLPPAVCTLQYFPIWAAQGGEVIVSGISVVMLLLCCVPFHKQIRAYFKSPAAWTMWLAVFVICALFENIIHSVVTIAFVGFVGNAIGALLFKWRDRYKEEK
jgi:energy-converting hydrogenase Eha subunit A